MSKLCLNNANMIFGIKSIFIVISLMLCSCITDYLGKVHTPDIDIRNVNGIDYAYHRGNLYSGDVYSSDEKHMMTIRNGIGVSAIIYTADSDHPWLNDTRTKTIKESLSDLQQKNNEMIEKYGELKTLHEFGDRKNNGLNPGQELKISLTISMNKDIIEIMNMLPHCSFAK